MEIKLHEPTFGEEEIAAVVEVLRSTRVTSGNKVKEFERLFGPNTSMVNSGSSANLLAVAASCNPMTPDHLAPGDEVIVSALSWSTTIWPLVQYGLIPKIVDIDPLTLNIDPNEVERAIGPRTRGIMPVHVYGNPCDMTALSEISNKHDLWLIEDCCEALGSTYEAQEVGSWGDFSTFSFYFSHHITTLEGGLIKAKMRREAELVRILRAHGWTRDLEDDSYYRERSLGIDPRFLFVNAGYNLRATEVDAAIGLVQLPKLASFVLARRKVANQLIDICSQHPDMLSIQHETPGGESSWFGFTIIVNDEAPFSARGLRKYLSSKGIENRSVICGNIARQPGMQLWPYVEYGHLRNADRVMRGGFSIGCHQAIQEEEINHFGRALYAFINSFGAFND